MRDMDKKNKFIYLSSLAILVIAGVVLVYFFYQLYYPFKTVTFQSEKFKVETPVVKAGENLIYISDACKYADVPVVISRSFTNGLVYNMPPSASNRPIGCGVDRVVVTVPKELPQGTYYLRNVFVYEISHFRNIVVRQDTESFEVVNE